MTVIASIAVAVAVLTVPTVLVLALLILLGTAVATMADGGVQGRLVRRTSA